MSRPLDDLLRGLAGELKIDPSPGFAAKVRGRMAERDARRAGRLRSTLAAAAVGVVLLAVAIANREPQSSTLETGAVVSVPRAEPDPLRRDGAPPAARAAGPAVAANAAASVTARSAPEVLTSQPALLGAMWERAGREARLDTAAIEIQGPEPPPSAVAPVTADQIAVEPIVIPPDDRRSRR